MHATALVRVTLLGGLGLLGAHPAFAQTNQGSNPASAIVRSLIAKSAPSVTAQRTLDVLRAAGVLNVRTDSPFTLSARRPFLDPQTYLTFVRSSLYPDRNVIVLNDAATGLEDSLIKLHWFGNPDRRYVVDCAFASGAGDVRFEWPVQLQTTAAPSYAESSIIDGRAAVVLPRGASAEVTIRSGQAAELSSCDVTPFDG